MRIFYENLVNPVENIYEGVSTVENVLYLEDIFKNVTTDIYVQHKSITSRSINYSLSTIEISGVAKLRNHLYYVNNYRSTYNNYTSIETNKDNIIKIVVTNPNITSTVPLTADIYLNDVLLETLSYSDNYTINNQKTIQVSSVKLGTTINITLPLYISQGEYVEYRLYTINVTEEPSLHKYLCTFDKPNNALIFDRKYNDYSINVLVQSRGSILRASTINELYRLNSNSFIQYDETTNKLIVPVNKVFKDSTKLRYVKSQYVIIDPEQLSIGYSLLGIYLDDANVLAFDEITNNVNYSVLMESINNYTLDSLRKTRQYYGFIIGLNNITKFTPIDIHMYGLGAGSGGSSSGGVEKISVELINVEEITINYASGTVVPTIVVFDDQGNQVVPERVHYNYSNQIVITLGELMNGLVAII